jgi:hypothetical protein
MAFEADKHVIQRYQKTKLERGLPVDPDFAFSLPARPDQET